MKAWFNLLLFLGLCAVLLVIFGATAKVYWELFMFGWRLV